ncbi:adenosine 5'-monophosphoramidase HINT3-like isoform X2 [Boleophthalmus pectinirostris]|uniref:adenosine 5'-monophosphoramidase HINT3-like isoform X2 n=1 Tax=Boleophthalmus pectinirostris TaxID=150288 RepID=UPI00242FD806|nr:adenosine 5'-monophosphoramidase HINT3-like isoform X2 [Boleophthalmus pectinirostris]
MEPQGAPVQDDCKFCHIANNLTDTEILMSDCEVVCFRDLKPGATHHYLIISNKHIDNCMKLQPDHIKLVEQMKDMGMRILQMNNVSDLDDIRMGFHVPPFSSVPHLHLHVLAPGSQMSHKSMLRYGPQSHWFITTTCFLS